MNSHFDVLVIGAGPGGYTAAIRSAQLGKRVAIVEERMWGGVCLNVGCIPSKSLIDSAQVVRTVKEAGAYGITIAGEVTYDLGAAFTRSRSVTDGRVKGIHYLMKKNDITEFEAHGAFLDSHSMALTYSDGRIDTLTFDAAIIATGALTRLLPGSALSDRVVTYKEQILAERLPSSIIIAGAGAIGVEFAYILNSYGVDVTLVEYADRIVPLEDIDVSRELTKRFKKLGIKMHTASKVTKVEDNGEAVRVELATAKGLEVLAADKLLQAIGFRPRVLGFGLELTGVKLTDAGAIAVDEDMRTNVPHITAIGDVTAKLMLAHVAEAMGLVAAATLAGEPAGKALDYSMMPRATYSQPQIASFGFTEEQARAEGLTVEATVFPFLANAKAHTIGDPGGFVKLLTDVSDLSIIGAHLIGPEVTELLPELTLAQLEGLSVRKVAHNVHAHPTLSEAVKEALHGAAGRMINL